MKILAHILSDNILISDSTDINSSMDLLLLLLLITSSTFAFCFVVFFLIWDLNILRSMKWDISKISFWPQYIKDGVIAVCNYFTQDG